MLKDLGVLHLGGEDVLSKVDLGQNVAAHGHLADGGGGGGKLSFGEAYGERGNLPMGMLPVTHDLR